MRIVLAAAAILLALAAWVFWRDVLLLWPLLVPLIKGVWAKVTVLVLALAGKGFVANSIEELLGLLARRFTRWLPTKAARAAASVFLPPAVRSAFKSAQRLARAGLGRLHQLTARAPGGLIGLTLSLTGTIAVCVLAYVLFGLPAVVVFKYVPEVVWSALAWLWAYVITFLFRFSMWRGLTRALGHFWDGYTPALLRDRFKRWRGMMLRHAIRSRKAMVRGADRPRRVILSSLRRSFAAAPIAPPSTDATSSKSADEQLCDPTGRQ